MSETIYDLLIVGAGPTGIAIGAEAKKAGLNAILVDRGQLTQAILEFPTYMTFFTTRDKLEIAGIPFTIPAEKPTRQDALLYYRAVAATYGLNLALYESVVETRRGSDGLFTIVTRTDKGEYQRRARALVLATGYFNHPLPFDVPGAKLPFVHRYYQDPYRHFRENVVLIGGGNTACEAALDLWRNQAGRVTLVVRGPALKDGVKYWVRPDVENRITEGSIDAHFNSTVTRIMANPKCVVIRHESGTLTQIPADAVYAFIGFKPDAELERRCGIEVDPKTLVPKHNPETCETNVPGLYVAGTIQAGLDTGRIFIENSREHAPKIVGHLRSRL